MRVLICHNEYTAPSGEEHAIQEFIGLMHRNGHIVDTFLRSSASICGTGDKLKALLYGIHSPGACRELRMRLGVNLPDIAFVQNLYPLLSPSILPVLRRAGVPVVMRCPNYRLFCPSGLHLTRGEVCERCVGGREYWEILRNCEDDRMKSIGYAIRNAAARVTGRIVDNINVFIVLSEFQRLKFVANGLPFERVQIVPNVMPSVADEELTDDVGEWVTFVGRVSPEKGIEDFLSAAFLLPDIPFAVAGAFDRMPGLVQHSPPNVKWLGFLKEPELNDTFRLTRILVCPSRCYEGFPNVITRAMLFKRPVIAARIGAIPEIVDEDVTGFLHAPQCVEELASKIRLLYGDITQCRQMGLAGHAKASRCYSREVVGRRLEEILRHALTQ